MRKIKKIYMLIKLFALTDGNLLKMPVYRCFNFPSFTTVYGKIIFSTSKSFSCYDWDNQEDFI